MGVPIRGVSTFLSGADKFLLLAIAAAFLNGLQGINWGWYGCLNEDAMAFRSIRTNPPLHPGSFDKPPLLPYINNVLINEPTKLAANTAVWLGADKHNAESARQHWRTLLSRLLQFAFYAGTIIFCFVFARDWFGGASARIIAVLLGTCSGFVPYKIFLTVDMPLVFFMTACLWLSGRIMRHPDSIRLSLAAGACAGLATATKYNGLGVAIALPLAHFLAHGGFRAAWRRPSFYAAGLAVPLAFVLANPYSVLDAQKFTADFMYNYSVTPVYAGETGVGYWRFVMRFPEIFGWPLSLLLPALVALSLLLVVFRKEREALRAMVILASVFGLYYWKIGAFPRVEARFVLPVATAALLLTGPAWQWLSQWRWLVITLVAPLAAYGMASGWFVGRIFAEDPRMEAILWARANMPRQAVIEAAASPRWMHLQDRDIKVTRIPSGVRRNEIFADKLGDNPWVRQRLTAEQAKSPASFFTPEALRARNPDFITFDSGYYYEQATHPFMKRLVDGEFGYRVVFCGETPAPPRWVYPQNPDFTRVRFWILARD